MGFMDFSQSYGKQVVSFCEVIFCGKSYFLQSQVAKIGFKVFRKSFVQAFYQVRFFWQVCFLAKSIFSKDFGKSLAFVLFQSKVNFVGKIGLVKNYVVCKIKSVKARFCFLGGESSKSRAH